MSVLEDLYSGNIMPIEKYIQKDSEYQKLNSFLCDDLDMFLSLLNDNEKMMYEKIENYISQLHYISEKEIFVEGFILGAKIILDIYSYRSKNFI